MNLPDSLGRIRELSRKESIISSSLVVLIASLLIVSTYHNNSPTWDEPTHIAAALELLQSGEYTIQTENPPLSRLPTAIGPFLDGARIEVVPSRFMFALGNEVLYSDEGFLEHRLTIARLGVLPFFILSAAIIWLWLAETSFLSAAIGVFLFSTLPMVLAHSGLATTDVPFLALFLLAAYSLRLWIESPNKRTTFFMGFAVGAAIATKFTAIPFLVTTGFAFLVCWLWFGRANIRQEILSRISNLGIAFAVCLITIWVAYAFDVGKINEFPESTGLFGQVYGEGVDGLRGFIGNFLIDKTIPAPGFFHGLLMVAAHNEAGHRAYSLGQFSQYGFWFYYPLTMFVKTPIPFLILLFAGIGSLVYKKNARWWQWGSFFAMLLVFASLLSSNVNIGGRHAMTIYPLTIVAITPQLSNWLQSAGQRFWGIPISGLTVVTLMLWPAVTVLFTFPAYLSYSNWFAGKDPGYVVNDSDLDWGQSVYALRNYLEDINEPVSLFYNGSARLCDMGLERIRPYSPDEVPSGLVIISERVFRIMVARVEGGEEQFPIAPVRSDICDPMSFGQVIVNAEQLQWLLTEEPITIIDKTLRVYRI
ncbi:MAG: glycosyltransferase family 39 protein [Gammaproteobacteria bacterium]